MLSNTHPEEGGEIVNISVLTTSDDHLSDIEFIRQFRSSLPISTQPRQEVKVSTWAVLIIFYNWVWSVVTCQGDGDK